MTELLLSVTPTMTYLYMLYVGGITQCELLSVTPTTTDTCMFVPMGVVSALFPRLSYMVR